ncbi:coat protein [West African Asystasia virus 1]|uniref:Capsid protein n=1 Tax=West African Asystasia virus 1 TaxID=1046573 RepID=G9CM24_9GEMI|nr:coat protein [West African Asystasia virus 1]AEI91429.1 coat protein [West African Asystasia virus 1]ALQ10783.1 AV1 [West African Asystasia virus 1]ALQ10800.1 AV1 [West African Asystasia virus 1]ALQ10807.1 AV1 [West African Asystasia virus 1]
MSKRPADIVISTPASKVRRRLNFDSPRASVPNVRVTRRRVWANRPMYRKPALYRKYTSRDVPRGCEGPCKVQSFDQRDDVKHLGVVRCLSDVTRGPGITHRVGKRFCIKSVLFTGKIWMDDNIKKQNHTNIVLFFLVRDRRPYGSPQDFGDVFNMFDNEPSTATVKNDLRDRYQVLRRFSTSVTGGPSACKEQALVRRFFTINHNVVYNHQEAAKYENHTENALLLYMACTHASNPVYASLKVRIYFYDSVGN